MYTYQLLDPRPANRAVVLDYLNSTPVLGVEVTVPELAAACQLGNIDPQHSGGDADTAAIEAALTADLPPSGTVLATIRPDADAYGAMAVLTLRAEIAKQGDPDCRDCVDHGDCEQHQWERIVWLSGRYRPWITAIGEADRSASADLPGGQVTPLDALRAACLSTRNPEAGVRIARQYVTAGEFDGMPEWQRRVAAERQETAAVAETVALAANGRVAVVESTSRYAVQAAYQFADVVVAVNPEFRRPGAAADEPPHRKVTICQQRGGLLNMTAVFAALGERESGWGGSPTIGGSPQGVASIIPTDDVVAVVQQHLSAT